MKVVFSLVGPTASGKSALALSLAQRFPIEIISMDSAMVYQGMDLGTAKPTIEERTRIPHHLIDILPIFSNFSVGDFFTRVEQLIPEIWGRNHIPLIVGGSFMYFNALKNGIVPMPKTNQELRNILAEKKATIGLFGMYQLLKKIDQEYSQKIASSDWKRISRGLEIYYLTGEKPSVVANHRRIFPFPLTNFYLQGELKELRFKIKQRLDRMLREGFIEEVKNLIASGARQDSTAMQNIGYKQIFQYLKKEVNFTVAYQQILWSTGRLAKHQITWLKKWKEESYWFRMEENLEEILGKIIGQQVCN